MKRSLRSWLWRVPLDQEVDEEIAFHIEMRTRELVERGMDPKAAREIVLSRIGDLGQLKRTCEDLGRKRDREMRMTQWLEDLKDDVTVALRQLKASPAFTAVAVLTLALGIGANSAMFAVADATLLRPLPFPDADRLVMVSEIRPNGRRGTANPLDFVDWSERDPHVRGDGRRDERSSIDHRRRRYRPTAGDTSRHQPFLRCAWRQDRSSAAHSSPATRDQDPMWSCCPKDSGEATSARTRHWWAAAPAWAGER